MLPSLPQSLSLLLLLSQTNMLFPNELANLE